MSTALARFADVRDYLYGLKHRGANYGIDRMRLLVERLGHPERRYPVIHVAGTNGKGSTCAMLEAVFRASGYRTGLFTSPHLVYQGERVQVDRQILSHEEIVHYTRHLRPVAEAIEAAQPGFHPSFFEFMTAMAFLRFAAAAVDIGIIETGLGGRLDATNVVHPELSIITSIGFDHMEILGDTLAAIAAEKAGIIKPGVPVVMGLLPPEAEAVIARVAAERGSKLHSVRDVFGDNPANYPQTVLPGEYQRRNAATVALAVRILRQSYSLPNTALQSGLQSVEWAGRWQRLQLSTGSLILDASHNPEGVAFLDQQLAEFRRESGSMPRIAVGALGHARAAALLPVVAKHASELYLLVPEQPRACTQADLRACLPADTNCPIIDATVRGLFPAPNQCSALTKSGETLVATGSIYLIGEILEAVRHPEPVGEAVLQD